MIPPDKAAEIRRLYFAEHWKKGTIVAHLGVHEDVVDRVVGPLGPTPKLAPPRPSMLDPYRGFVEGKYADSVELVDGTLENSDIRKKVLVSLERALPSAAPGRAVERAMTLVEGRDMQLAMIAWETMKRLGEDPPDVREPTQGEPIMPKAIIDRVFVLEGVQLFHGLSVDDLAAVAGITTEGHAAPREIIYREGDPGDSMYIIASGEVHLLRGADPLLDLYAGDSFGHCLLYTSPSPRD